MTPTTRDPLKHLAWFLSLPEAIRQGINERRVKAGMEPHGVPEGVGPDVHETVNQPVPVNIPPPPFIVAPEPMTEAEATTAWNHLTARYREEKRGLDAVLSALGRGPEYEAILDGIAALKVEGRGLRPLVEAALKRELTEAERTGGIQS